MAERQQKATQKGGMRPFGISLFLAGFYEGAPHLYMSEPSGAMTQWKASAIGKRSKELREHLEEHYTEDMSQQDSLKLAVGTMLEVVESSKNLEICMIKPGNLTETISSTVVQGIIDQINAEKAAKEEERKGGNK